MSSFLGTAMCPYTSRMFKVKIERSDSCVISEGVDEVVHSSGAFQARENLDLGANCLFRFVARGDCSIWDFTFWPFISNLYMVMWGLAEEVYNDQGNHRWNTKMH